MIRYSEQEIDHRDIDGIQKVLTSKYLTQGPLLETFEDILAKSTRANYAACVSSATAALHLTYLAAGMSPEKLIWTVANTFVATASAAVYCGAQVDFVDIELKNYSICVKDFLRKLRNAERIPDYLVVVHFSGRAVDLSSIAKICKQYGITIIEDASHALGAECHNKKVGECEYSLATIFSFHPVKTITTAEGGGITSNNKELIKNIKKLRSHSVESDTSVPWYKEQSSIGYNYRMTELQASLGITQSEKLFKFQSIRKKQAQYYFAELSNLNIYLPNNDSIGSISSWHLFVIRERVTNEKMRNSKMKELIKRDIGVNLHYFPLYRLSTFRKNISDFPKNEEYFKSAFSLPLSLQMTEGQQSYIIDNMKKLF